MNPRFASIPGYAEAARLQDLRRDAAFLDLPLTLCGVECCHLTPRRLAVLMVSQSPFVCGGLPMPEHVAQFLWALDPEFDYTASRKREKFIQRIASLAYDDAVKQIADYVDEVFMDSPASDSGQIEESCNSWLASIVDALASEYGWSQAQVLDTPIACVFQYLRIIERRHNPKALKFNRLTDRAKNQFLEALNQPKAETN